VGLEGGPVSPIEVEGAREGGSGVRVRPVADATFERGDRRGTEAGALAELLLRQPRASAKATQQGAEVVPLGNSHSS
jgi:hypothetical protein